MILSDKKVPPITAKNPAMFGGTVNSCAVTLVYPKAFIMVGRKSEKEYITTSCRLIAYGVMIAKKSRLRSRVFTLNTARRTL